MGEVSPIRVLIADDSPTARALLTAVLETDAGVTVVAEAVDGAHAVELARVYRPSVVLMDIEMPGMNGFEATKQIMTNTPTRVIVVSGRYEPHQVEVGLEAVRCGALTIIPKPTAAPDSAEYEEQARRLVALVKALADTKVVRQHGPLSDGRAARAPVSAALEPRGLEAVGVGASTGGPVALELFLRHLPETIRAPILVVQHIAAGFVEGLASWLAAGASLPVTVATDGELLSGGHVYLAPDDWHMQVRDRRVVLGSGPSERGFRPSADALFSSLAAGYGSAAAAVVLSGMGQDGVEGARAVRAAGGLVLAQNETAVIFGMPRAVAAAGLAHLVGSAPELAEQVARSATRPVVVA